MQPLNDRVRSLACVGAALRIEIIISLRNYEVGHLLEVLVILKFQEIRLFNVYCL